jgi:hypothetical protein
MANEHFDGEKPCRFPGLLRQVRRLEESREIAVQYRRVGKAQLRTRYGGKGRRWRPGARGKALASYQEDKHRQLHHRTGLPMAAKPGNLNNGFGVARIAPRGASSLAIPFGAF